MDFYDKLRIKPGKDIKLADISPDEADYDRQPCGFIEYNT